VHCTPEQIVIVSGSRALDLTTRMLVNPAARFGWKTPATLERGAFPGSGAQIIPCQSMVRGWWWKRGWSAPQARLGVPHPFAPVPTGRYDEREAAVGYAGLGQTQRGVHPEDDYDSEFRYAGRPLAALQGLDEAGR
jgi:GntR family transcriptional regulator/MocR family aminotransferase